MTPIPLHKYELEVKKLSKREYEDYVKQIITGFRVVNEIKEFNDYVGSVIKQKNQDIGQYVDYKIGDVVLYMKPHCKAKLTTRYYGPYVIYGIINPHTYRIRNEMTGRKLKSPINGELLFPYRRRGKNPKRIEDYWQKPIVSRSQDVHVYDDELEDEFLSSNSISGQDNNEVPFLDKDEESSSEFDDMDTNYNGVEKLHSEKISNSTFGEISKSDDDVDEYPEIIFYLDSS